MALAHHHEGTSAVVGWNSLPNRLRRSWLLFTVSFCRGFFQGLPGRRERISCFGNWTSPSPSTSAGRRRLWRLLSDSSSASSIAAAAHAHFSVFEYRSPSFEAMPRLDRTLQVDQNATVQFSLSVPMVSHGSSGRFDVSEDGRAQPRSFNAALALRDGYQETPTGRRSWSFSGVNVDWHSVRNCGGRQQPSRESGVGQAHRAWIRRVSAAIRRGHSVRTEDHAVIPPVMLPENWIDYSGLDIIAVSLKTLEQPWRLRMREAILKWTECGGTLLIYSVGKPADQSDDAGFDPTPATRTFSEPGPCLETSGFVPSPTVATSRNQSGRGSRWRAFRSRGIGRSYG